ncbi:hypothetical protein [Pontibacillus litoralis]|uniref:Uncharacterized protein n=1 Tax=Pontibacillus litoralis JSM 072002 TaxID=1385512 RepID=A0A0A5G4E7_9BACI|nr:hypothetical protein [Pontibacillus litoralis]KGX86934.1 hypothetical protein N784_03005 [Pontibacillus litoralis JSM 072002]
MARKYIIKRLSHNQLAEGFSNKSTYSQAFSRTKMGDASSEGQLLARYYTSYDNKHRKNI